MGHYSFYELFPKMGERDEIEREREEEGGAADHFSLGAGFFVLLSRTWPEMPPGTRCF